MQLNLNIDNSFVTDEPLLEQDINRTLDFSRRTVLESAPDREFS